MKSDVSNPQILVLGATGMVGRVVYARLKSLWPDSVFGTSRAREDEYIQYDASDTTVVFEKLFGNLGRVDYVVNCIGLLRVKPKLMVDRIEAYIQINSLFPQQLAVYCLDHNIKLLHISSDAVFSDLAGTVTERTPVSPSDIYGLSKALGESGLKSAISIRTSVIGFDPKNNRGLIELVHLGTGPIEGYTNQLFCGCTVLQLSDFVLDMIAGHQFDVLRTVSQVYHFVPLAPVSKYQLLKQVNATLAIKRKLIISRTQPRVSRRLTSQYDGELVTKKYAMTLKAALEELVSYEASILDA